MEERAPPPPTPDLPALNLPPALPELPPIDAPPEKPKPERKRRKFIYKVLLFEKYALSEVTVHDPGLARHINLSPLILPHTGGRYAAKPFGKAKMNIVERLVNGMMRTENFTGKKTKAIQVVRLAMEKIAGKTKQNAVQKSFSSAKGGRGKSIVDCLADELLLAARGDMTSQAIQKKEELERVAASAR